MTKYVIMAGFLSWMAAGGLPEAAAAPQESAGRQPEGGGTIEQPPSGKMAQQKLQLVKMMLASSPVMQRAASSDDEGLRKQVAEILARYAAANNALNSGDVQRADRLADEVLGLLEEVSRLSPDVQLAENTQRARYYEEMKSLNEAESAYLNLRKRLGAVNPKAAVSVNELVRKQKEDAQALARAGRYREATDLLKAAHAETVTAFNKLLGETVLTHDLKFESAKEEYEYELARYHSYEELAPIAYAELKPDEFTLKLSERYVQESRVMRDTAKQQAERGDHKEAIKTLLEAVKRMQAALRVLGLVLQE